MEGNTSMKIVSLATDKLICTQESDQVSTSSQNSSILPLSGTSTIWDSESEICSIFRDFPYSDNFILEANNLKETETRLLVQNLKYSEQFPKELRPIHAARVKKRGIRRYKGMCIESAY